jgi:leukotriene-A4 hydrolase
MHQRIMALYHLLFIVFYMPTAMADFHSLSNIDSVSVTHMSLDLDLDFNKENFYGKVELSIIQKKITNVLILDTAGLTIKNIRISDDRQNWILVEHTQKYPHTILGSALHIPINQTTTWVNIEYETTAQSKGLDWVKKEHTSSLSPMVVTHFEPIMARSFVPCQDSPKNRITYDATIRLHASDTNTRVLMAADERSYDNQNTYRFKMTKSIPTYLIALAAGVFQERQISNRVSIFAEPSIIEKAAKEFANAEKMLEAAEQLFGPYQWGRYDILVMPKSFSAGGMENPTLTFVSPSTITGDQSMENVIAHEIAHAWFGNLVTNQDWNHLWLNEGITVYAERLIMEKLYGSDVRDMEIVLGQHALKNVIDSLKDKPNMTTLRTYMDSNVSPREALSLVPYEKGCNFMLWLEKRLGKAGLLDFLNKYVKKYAFQSISTEHIKQDIEMVLGITEPQPVSFATFSFGMPTHPDVTALSQWLYGYNHPSDGLPKWESDLLKRATEAGQSFVLHHKLPPELIDEAKLFKTRQWSYFLNVSKGAKQNDIRWLDEHFYLSLKNPDIRHEFLLRAIEAKMPDYDANIREFVASTGRLKYIKPIYQKLIDRGQKNFAQSIYNEAKSGYNAITIEAIEKIIK